MLDLREYIFVAASVSAAVVMAGGAFHLLIQEEERIEEAKSVQQISAPISDQPPLFLSPSQQLEPVAGIEFDAPLARSAETSGSTDSCDIDIETRSLPGAMLGILVTAPCAQGQTVTLTHDAFTIVGSVSADGHYDTMIPALQAVAGVTVELGDEIKTQHQPISDFGAYERVALISERNTSLSLHALEFGAAYGSGGHIWRQSVGDISRPETARGGFLSSFETETGIVDVYSLPGHLLKPEMVELSVELEVTAENCGSDIEANLIEYRALTGHRTETISFSVPACDAIGDILVLNNLLQNMKIAQN